MTVRRRGAAPPLAAACLAFALAGACAAEQAASGQALYDAECSKCHGVLSVDEHAAEDRAALVRAAFRPGKAVAFALPYGPSLRGVLGRAAGSVPSFDYSRAFRRAFDGLTWDRDTLDAYITDSQARAPGARMFYRQPDPAVRRAIIDFLAGAGGDQ